MDEGEGVLCRQPDPSTHGAPRKTGVFDKPRGGELEAILSHLMGRRRLIETEHTEHPRRGHDTLEPGAIDHRIDKERTHAASIRIVIIDDHGFRPA